MSSAETRAVRTRVRPAGETAGARRTPRWLARLCASTASGPAPGRAERGLGWFGGPRVRLLLATLGLLAAVCLAVGSISLLLLRGFLVSQLDDQLVASAARSVALARSSGQDSSGRSADHPSDHGSDDSSGGDSSGNDSSGGDSSGGDSSGSGSSGGDSRSDSSGGDSSGSHSSGGDSSGGDSSDRGAGDVPWFLQAAGQAGGTLGAQLDAGHVARAGVVENDGHVAAVADSTERAVLASVPADGRPYSRQVGPLGAYRLVALSTDTGEVVVTGLSLGQVQAVVSRLALIELAVATAGVAAAGALAAVIVRVTMRPLRRVAATAGRVAELRLDRGEVALAERVPARDTDLRTEVGQVGAALNRMLEHVAGALAARQASETQLRRFLADASHELRTPLAAIRGYTELTLRSANRGEADVSTRVAYALRRVSSQAERMTSLVEDMLLLARLDAGRQLAHEPVDLTRLVVDAVSDAHVAGPDHRWVLRVPDQAVLVWGDGARLAQVLGNLLTNARIHTPAGTTVLAALEVGAEPGPGWVVVRVLDDGPGIPPDLLPRVFARFARGDESRSRSANQSAGSTGLGLAIATAVVSAHGGRVGVRSVPGRTEFTVRLPTTRSG